MMCNYLLGGRDNRSVDRAACHTICENAPGFLDAARSSRLFMYRAVRYLARYARVGQFLDLGCGFPLNPDVHEVARRFHRPARTVYVDNDPLVVVHARALLATGGHTTAVAADITTPGQVFADPGARQMLDLAQPVAVLVLSVGHLIGDEAALRMLTGIADRICPGSYLVLTHLAGVSKPAAQRADQAAGGAGLGWRFRTPAQVRSLLATLPLRPVRPGLVEVTSWRPDPKQPHLYAVDTPLKCHLDPFGHHRRLIAFGGVLRRIETNTNPTATEENG